MSERRLSVCRWCGKEPGPSRDPQGRGRPPAFCCRDHRRLHVATFGGPAYDGAIQLTEDCDRTCALHGTVVALPGPVRAPGAWADAVATVARFTHGHDVAVRLEPVEHALDATMWQARITPAQRAGGAA